MFVPYAGHFDGDAVCLRRLAARPCAGGARRVFLRWRSLHHKQSILPPRVAAGVVADTPDHRHFHAAQLALKGEALDVPAERQAAELDLLSLGDHWRLQIAWLPARERGREVGVERVLRAAHVEDGAGGPDAYAAPDEVRHSAHQEAVPGDEVPVVELLRFSLDLCAQRFAFCIKVHPRHVILRRSFGHRSVRPFRGIHVHLDAFSRRVQIGGDVLHYLVDGFLEVDILQNVGRDRGIQQDAPQVAALDTDDGTPAAVLRGDGIRQPGENNVLRSRLDD